MHSINPDAARAGGTALTPLVPLVRAVVADQRRRYEGSTITLKGASGDPRVALGENDLRSVVGNLVVNALEVTSGDEALKSVAENPGCVLLLDITMPGMNGLEVVHRLAERSDDVKVVMLSAREDRDALFSAISAGARGYVAKDAEPEQLYAAIDLVFCGGTVLSTGMAANLGEGIRQLDYAPGAYEQRRLELTDRELEILRLLATPRFPAQIAAQLFLSKKTGQNHISAIYRKLDVRSRSEAIVKGMELHLIDSKG